MCYVNFVLKLDMVCSNSNDDRVCYAPKFGLRVFVNVFVCFFTNDKAFVWTTLRLADSTKVTVEANL